MKQKIQRKCENRNNRTNSVKCDKIGYEPEFWQLYFSERGLWNWGSSDLVPARETRDLFFSFVFSHFPIPVSNDAVSVIIIIMNMIMLVMLMMMVMVSLFLHLNTQFNEFWSVCALHHGMLALVCRHSIFLLMPLTLLLPFEFTNLFIHIR